MYVKYNFHSNEDYKNFKDVASCQIEEPWKKEVLPRG